MKIERNSANIKKGAEIKAYLERKDAQIKSMSATTAGVAEGVITFPTKKEKWELVSLTWTGRDGVVRDYPAVICKDSEGTEHAIALTAFREKDEVITMDGTTIKCSNLCEFDADYGTIWTTLQAAKTVTLHRIVGRRNNRKGRYEFFTMEK